MRPISPGLRPQDVLVLLKLITEQTSTWRQLDFAAALGLSQAEIANALERLRRSGLVADNKRQALRLATHEFLVHGLKYIYPPEYGPNTRGIATAHSALPLSKKIVQDESDALVWPSEEGDRRGMALAPIYPSAPLAAKRDPELHELLAIVDAIRSGRARVKKLAEEALKKRLIDTKK